MHHGNTFPEFSPFFLVFQQCCSWIWYFVRITVKLSSVICAPNLSNSSSTTTQSDISERTLYQRISSRKLAKKNDGGTFDQHIFWTSIQTCRSSCLLLACRIIKSRCNSSRRHHRVCISPVTIFTPVAKLPWMFFFCFFLDFRPWTDASQLSLLSIECLFCGVGFTTSVEISSSSVAIPSRTYRISFCWWGR